MPATTHENVVDPYCKQPIVRLDSPEGDRPRETDDLASPFDDDLDAPFDQVEEENVVPQIHFIDLMIDNVCASHPFPVNKNVCVVLSFPFLATRFLLGSVNRVSMQYNGPLALDSLCAELGFPQVVQEDAIGGEFKSSAGEIVYHGSIAPSFYAFSLKAHRRGTREAAAYTAWRSLNPEKKNGIPSQADQSDGDHPQENEFDHSKCVGTGLVYALACPRCLATCLNAFHPFDVTLVCEDCGSSWGMMACLRAGLLRRLPVESSEDGQFSVESFKDDRRQANQVLRTFGVRRMTKNELSRRRLFAAMRAQAMAAEDETTRRIYQWLPSTKASDRAFSLLLNSISISQRLELYDKTYFTQVGSAGGVYRIEIGFAHNIKRLAPSGRVIGIYCIHPAHPVPFGDAMLSQKLLIQHNEPEFLAVANRIPRSMYSPRKKTGKIILSTK